MSHYIHQYIINQSINICVCVCVCGGPFWDVRLGYLLLHWGLSVLGRRVRTGPIATHLGPACAQTMPIFLLKFWSHAHGKCSYYNKVTTDRYNGAIIKATLLDKTKLLQKSYSRWIYYNNNKKDVLTAKQDK